MPATARMHKPKANGTPAPPIVTETVVTTTETQRPADEPREVSAIAEARGGPDVSTRDIDAGKRWFDNLPDNELCHYTYNLYRLTDGGKNMLSDGQGRGNHAGRPPTYLRAFRAEPDGRFFASDVQSREREEEMPNFGEKFGHWADLWEWVRSKHGGGFYAFWVNCKKESGMGQAGEPFWRLDVPIEGDPIASSEREAALLRQFAGGSAVSPAPGGETGRLFIDYLQKQIEEVRKQAVSPSEMMQNSFKMAQELNSNFVGILKDNMAQAKTPEDQGKAIVNALKEAG